MTQDQYGQARGPGYVVRGEVVPDVVPDDETGEFPDEQERPLTRFQKVASALPGGDPEQDEQDRTADPAADRAAVDEAAATDSPVSREAQPRSDYWDEPTTPDAERDEAVAVTSPDTVDQAADQADDQAEDHTADHQATQPDMFGTATHAGNGAAVAPAAAGQVGATTIEDVPVSGVPAGGAAVGAPAAATGTATATGTAIATGTAGGEMRPGEAAAALGDFSDL